LKTLVGVEMALSIFLILFEAIIDIMVASSQSSDSPVPCFMGSGIWVGILGVITAGLGFGAFRSMYGNKCLMVANFVMCIICAVADGIMIIFAGICLGTLPHLMRGSYEWNSIERHSIFKETSPDTVSLIRGLIALEAFILLAAIAHLISSIVSTAFICRNWCQGSQPTVAVVYLGNANGTSGTNPTTGEIDPCRIAVPSGAQQYVILFPNGTQAVLPSGAIQSQSPLPQQYQPPQPEFRNLQVGEDKRV